GILHLLFHPAHIFKPGVADALIGAVAKAQDQGMAWWTAAEINRWERARRAVCWRAYQLSGEGVSVSLETPDPLPGATILWLLPSHALEPENAVTRWGRRFQVAAQPDEANSVFYFSPRGVC